MAESEFVTIKIPRAALQKDIEAEIEAFRDEKNLRKLTAEEREALGDNPAGMIQKLTFADFNKAGCTATFSNGVGCKGTPAFTGGITCCVIKAKTNKKKTTPASKSLKQS